MDRMNLQILKSERMQQSGKAVLRSLQNENLPITDVIIREAFQNSLDAAMEDTNYVEIQANVKEFDTRDISHYFEGITSELDKKFSTSELALSIRDSGTTGLSGIVEGTAEEKKKSKFYKLVYGLSMNQDEAGAGGSWGLGKTSYFRVGCGLVIYYSRSLEANGEFVERIAASLIENEEESSLLGNYSKKNAAVVDYTGIAWWGEKKTVEDVYSNTLPITNHRFIEEITNKFGVERYFGDETGTTIIIPFINKDLVELNEKKLSIKKEIFSEDNGLGRVYWWEREFEKSLEISIQRWYGPRLANQAYYNHFKRPFLMARVNNKIITNEEITFKIFQELYTAALVGTTENKKIKIQDINKLRGVLAYKGEKVGRVAYVVINKEELNMLAPNYVASPLAYIGYGNQISSDKTGDKILAYARKPGMVVEYVLNDSRWLGGIPIEEDHFLFSFFVPDSDAILSEDYIEIWPNLESYLRDTESADHANWLDKTIGPKRITILDRIRKQVNQKIKEYFNTQNSSGANTVISTLSREFGNIFLPPSNFGSSAKSVSGSIDTNKESRSTGDFKHKGSLFKVISSEPITTDVLKIKFEGNIGSNKVTRVETQVVTSDKRYNYEGWMDRMGQTVEYPFEIKKVAIISINDSVNNENEYDIIQIEVDDLHSIKLINTMAMKLSYEIEMLVKITNPLMNLDFSVQSINDKEVINNV